MTAKQITYLGALVVGLSAAFGALPVKYAVPGALALILVAQIVPDTSQLAS